MSPERKKELEDFLEECFNTALKDDIEDYASDVVDQKIKECKEQYYEEENSIPNLHMSGRSR